MKTNKTGVFLVFSSLLMIAAALCICILGVPYAVKIIMPNSSDLWFTGMLFLWATAAPVFAVMVILLLIAKRICDGIYVSKAYIKNFNAIGILTAIDTALYLIPLIFFILPGHFEFSAILGCLIIQTFGLCMCSVVFSASIIMTKASEYKEEVDTML